jgi:hypothetical protein
MRVQTLTQAPHAVPLRGPLGSGLGARFRLDSATETKRPSGSFPVGHLARLDALFAVQSVMEEGDRERRRRATQQAHDILDALEALKLAVLSGSVQSDQLARIAEVVCNRRETVDDPALCEILAHVEMRARIELAKRGIV